MIEGLQSEHTYYLTEVEAPDGYNKLDSAITIRFLVSNTNGSEFSIIYNDNIANGHTVYIQNNTGTQFPGTGGMGTTIFYLIGGIIVVAAVVVLVTRRRMKNSED